MLRRFAVAALAAAAVQPLFVPSAGAQGRQDFTLINRTGYEIREVYVSRSATNSWEEDVLGNDTLANGRSVNIRFRGNSSNCQWDLKVVYNDGDTGEWRRLNLCSISRVTIYFNRQNGTSRAVTE